MKQTDDIALHGVESSQIAQIGYDAASKTMAIQFKGYGGKPGATYYYDNVTAEQYAAMQKADSKGKWFGENLKHNAKAHPYRRLADKRKD